MPNFSRRHYVLQVWFPCQKWAQRVALLESRPNQILVFITNPYKILLPEFECSVCFSVVPEVHPRNKCNCQCVVKAFFLVPYFCKIFQTSRPNQIFMLVANFSTIWVKQHIFSQIKRAQIIPPQINTVFILHSIAADIKKLRSAIFVFHSFMQRFSRRSITYICFQCSLIIDQTILCVNSLHSSANFQFL